MFSVRFPCLIIFLVTLSGLAGCDGLTDDLLPSGEDKREDVVAGSIGVQVSQQSPDFSVLDTLGNSRGLYAELDQPGVAAVVLYFTMWCPVCDVHMSHMRKEVIPDFPAVSFFLVDYVTGSVSASRSAQLSNGYADIETLVDADQALFDLYEASMGTTIVIESAGKIVRMNEDYKDGMKLTEILQAL